MGKKRLGDRFENLARRRQYTLTAIVAIFTIGGILGGGTAALVEWSKDAPEPSSSNGLGEPPLPDAPIFVIVANRVDPWAPWSEGHHVVCTRIANVGPQPGLLGSFRMRLERSDGRFTIGLMTENLTRVDGDGDDLFVAPFSTALFRAEYVLDVADEANHYNFRLDAHPVRGTGDHTYWGGDDTLDCPGRD